ncbi:chemotaxis protein CheW [Bosea caraganae]|uniref:Chemotaxis protein CheW n=1 Tax=Bosea caraganae TaxID=2763117 RepID=A0A370KYA3_9HYPH|nr:chemotaxis protein CheW [Bosea caraganae]RDJ19965.1 chemotaxis protein CheW [Bosea caraganae]RDJ23904.1 chemotaxis protein CheW [Bosea caraganae]
MDAIQTQAGAAVADAMQVVMVGLGSEIFALEAGLVREIIDPVPTTKVAGARAFLPSLINVRGNVVPLADIRVRFGMPHRPETADTRIVVIDIEIDGDPVTVGIIADKVYEVTEISRAQTQQTPRLGMHWKPEFVHFITKWNDEFVIVPNMEQILN